MTLCYYITGHGFGHSVRAAQVIRALPADLRLIIKTTAPQSFFYEELPGREFTLLRDEYDCGVLQTDSVTVRPRETLDRYAQIARANNARLADEVGFLRREGVRCVVTDVPSFPLRAAREAGVPGLIVANFTWHDIYREYVETREDAALLAHMADEYATATRALITPLAVPTVAEPFPRVERVPLVARRGCPVRASLSENLGRMAARRGENGTHLALLYLGQWGLDIAWDALARWRDWTFLTYDAPSSPVDNVAVLDRAAWPYAEAAASVDAVVSKAGYGIVTECIANGVPLVYLPRAGWAEHDALVSGMVPWGGGIEMSVPDFRSGNWGAALEAARSARLNPHAYATDGAGAIAARIRDFCTATEEN